jgi:ATP-dependent DNA helicase RecG
MNREELVVRLKKYEWNDIEFKKAPRGVPDDAYESVSAIANTFGGYLVFSVQDNRGTFDVAGVSDVDKVQKDFLSSLRVGNKFNRALSVRENARHHEKYTMRPSTYRQLFKAEAVRYAA